MDQCRDFYVCDNYEIVGEQADGKKKQKNINIQVRIKPVNR